MTTTVLEDVSHETDPHTHAVIRGYKLSGDSGANWRRFGLEFAVVGSCTRMTAGNMMFKACSPF